MERVTILLPEHQLTEVKALVEEGVYPNRSEAIRSWIREGLNSSKRLATDGGCEKPAGKNTQLGSTVQ